MAQPKRRDAQIAGNREAKAIASTPVTRSSSGGDHFEVLHYSAIRRASDGARPTPDQALRSRPIESAMWRTTMNALAFLLGARALDVARSRRSAIPSVPEAELPPIASTEETAAAWRRWA
jgi:hypothetical protein